MKIERHSILEQNPEIVHTSEFDNIELDFLVAFLETGQTENVPDHVVAYMEMLEKIWGMSRRMFEFPNDSAIISHIMILYKFKRPKAMQLVKDAMLYFSRETMMPNEVHRSKLADLGMKAFVGAIRLAKSSRDFKDSFMILIELGKFLGWDTTQMDEDDENFIRQLQIVSSDITMFGFEKVGRQELGTMIDALPDVSEKMKQVAKAEVDGIPFKMLFGSENPRKES